LPDGTAIYNFAPYGVSFVVTQYWLALDSEDSQNQSPASGGALVTVTGDGFDNTDDFENRYFCKFEGTSEQTVMTSVAATVLDSSTLVCVTPAWGAEYPVDLNGTLLTVAYNGTYVAPYGTTASHLVFFYSVWGSYAVDNVHGARGTDVLSFAASGLDWRYRGMYTCVFTRPGAHGTTDRLVSRNATARNVTHVECVAPPWGVFFSATDAHVELRETRWCVGWANYQVENCAAGGFVLTLTLLPSATARADGRG
jgi:hypothetical protein